VHPIPGQEERNADHLLEAGTAIRCNNLPALAWKIDRLLDDPARLAAMRAKARRLARPQAARDIAATLLGAARTGCRALPADEALARSRTTLPAYGAGSGT
jgi:UDP-N-acetylglucosamine:LPS N-acetylglucosamine transferase